MRMVSSAWIAVETARERAPALLFHVYAKRGGRVSAFPPGWGSWTYSVGFQDNVDFTDVADYAGDGIQTRTYVPAAIEYDASQPFRVEGTALDPHNIRLTVDPTLEPFAHYVNRRWPLTFGIVIYKVHRGDGIVTADDGHGNQVPVVDVIFVGYLDTDDTLGVNSAGLEKTIDGQPARLKLDTVWDHITKVFDRFVPRPVFSIDCPKALFSSGPAATACNADMGYAQADGVVVASNGVVVSAVEWGNRTAGWFAEGLLVYTATDPASGLDFTFALTITASAPRTAGGVTYGDLTLEMFPPLPIVGVAVTAYAGCDRTRATCTTKHIPVGSTPPPPGSFTPGVIEIALALTNTTTHASHALITVSPTFVSITYFKTDQNQIGSITINSTAWDPTWVSRTSGSIITSPAFGLGSGAGMPAVAGYHVRLATVSGTGPSISQQPKWGNDWTCVVKVSGAGTYDFTLTWTADAGQPVFSGNLLNFGGTDIPIEHPSLETTQ